MLTSTHMPFRAELLPLASPSSTRASQRFAPVMRLLVLVLPTLAGCFVPTGIDEVMLRCSTSADCLQGQLCLEGQCIPDDAPCLDTTGEAATFVADGSACGDEQICLKGACVAPRCGDGVQTGTETCDGTVDCREDCTYCGDGVLQSGEDCDNGGGNDDEQPGACRTDCQPSRCGDGVIDPGEGCDDGIQNDDIAPNACRTDCRRSSCGDGVIDEGEACDDGALNRDDEPNACRTACVRSSCGDGTVDEGEACDNGRQNSDVQPGACRTNCQPATCGDGVRDIDEECDEGTLNSDLVADACRETCVRATCGDGIVDLGEECDDGAANQDDIPNACRTTCVYAACGDGTLDEGEICDEGPLNSDVQPGACRTNCQPATCGDGVRDIDEECDEGAYNSDSVEDACRETCTRATCGDGVVDTGEVCDDGSPVSGDGCRADCLKVEECGDRVVDDGEACDDGNANPLDGCHACRLQEWVRDVVVSGRLDGELANETPLDGPAGLARDPLGRLYIVEESRHRVIRVDADRNVVVIAGTGDPGFSGDGGRATSAQLHHPSAVAVNASGEVFIADSDNHRIRKVDAAGMISTIAGRGGAGFDGDGGSAALALLRNPRGLAVDGDGQIYFADTENHRVRKIDAQGVITTVAGGAAPSAPLGDGGAATNARLYLPIDVALGSRGKVYIADAGQHRVRQVSETGIITTLAGTGAAGQVSGGDGDNGPAVDARVDTPTSVAVDGAGNVYIGAGLANRIRKVDLSGVISTVIGEDLLGELTSSPASGGNGPGLEPILAVDQLSPRLTLAEGGGLFVSDWSYRQRVLQVDSSNRVSILAGVGRRRRDGEGAPPTTLSLDDIRGMTVSRQGQLYVADCQQHRIVRVTETGLIETVAGLGVAGYTGDLGQAQDATLNCPAGLSFQQDGSLLFADRDNHAIRHIAPNGIIQTIAGNGTAGYAGNGTWAQAALLDSPNDVVVDDEGGIYIADTGNRHVRYIDRNGMIYTLTPSDGGLGGGLKAATGGLGTLQGALDLALSEDRGVYVAETEAHRVVLIRDGTLVPVAGTGIQGYTGDGGAADAAQLKRPKSIAFGPDGELYIADAGNGRIRVVDANGTIQTWAGGGFDASDEGALPADWQLNGVFRLFVKDDGQLYFTDTVRKLVRRQLADESIQSILGPLHPVGPGVASQARLYGSLAMVAIPSRGVVSVGQFGRALLWDPVSDAVEVVVGMDFGTPERAFEAPFAPLFEDARGMIYDEANSRLVITEYGTSTLRVLDLDGNRDGKVDDPSAWTLDAVQTQLVGPAGLVYDPTAGNFIVVDEGDHCVRRVNAAGQILETVFGQCGTPGSFPGFLQAPTHVAQSSSGAVYISDTGNHRVLRVTAAQDFDVVVGDGSQSSAGEGTPARLFPVDAPRQLALDPDGNLFVTSSKTIRLVANIDGDDDADGDDQVITIYGGGSRSQSPESDTFCLQSLAVDGDSDVYSIDTCQGFMVRLRPVTP